MLPENEVKEKLIVKIFIGFVVTAALKNELGNSKLWKKALISKESGELEEISFQDEKYIGLYALTSDLTLKQIETESEKISLRLKDFCPQNELDPQSVMVLSQIFLS